MKNHPEKIAKYLFYGLLMIAIITLGLTFYNEDLSIKGSNPILVLSYVYLLVSFGLMIACAIYSVILKKGRLKKIALHLLTLGGVIFISYLFSTDEVNPIYGGISKFTTRQADVLLITIYILLGFSVLAMIYSSIAKYFK